MNLNLSRTDSKEFQILFHFKDFFYYKRSLFREEIENLSLTNIFCYTTMLVTTNTIEIQDAIQEMVLH